MRKAQRDISDSRWRETRYTFFETLVCVIVCVSAAEADGQALQAGISADAAGRAGTLTAVSGDPIDAMQSNPAGLEGVHAPVLELSGVGVFASGSFRNRVEPHGSLSGVAGGLPYGALAVPLHHWTAAVSVAPDVLMDAQWHYVDPPGTAGASYGYQKNESEIITIRSAAGLAYASGSKWSVGGTVGLLYNRNTLEAPYIFQQQPQLAGLKVLLDLHTHGFGWDGSAGLQWHPETSLRLGVDWRSERSIASRGSASGTASAQFVALGVAADPLFHYRAQVNTHLPQSFAAGVAWQQNPHLLWTVDANWIQWRRAFRSLPVQLTEGTNATINSIVGSTTLHDEVALEWRDQFAVHAGVDLPVAHSWTLRAGYGYMSDPVPSATLTPMTAAILRNTVATGAGWRRSAWSLSAAYQAQLPASQSVQTSALRAGEYSQSRVQIRTQSLVFTSRLTF